MEVSANAPRLRPWNEPSIAISRLRPVSRVILKPASLASVPELVKNTRAGVWGWLATVIAANRSARAIWVGVAKKFDTCPRVESWAEIAPSTCGWACPSTFTASPASRSR